MAYDNTNKAPAQWVKTIGNVSISSGLGFRIKTGVSKEGKDQFLYFSLNHVEALIKNLDDARALGEYVSQIEASKQRVKELESQIKANTKMLETASPKLRQALEEEIAELQSQIVSVMAA